MVDVAVLVDGCRPIGARVRRIGEPELRLSLGGTPQSEAVVELVCRELEHLQDYCQPHAPGEASPAARPGFLPLMSPQCPDPMVALFGDDGVRHQLCFVPLFPGALLKAAFICTQVVQFPSQKPLRAQLMESFRGGFEVHTWSKLPHGSGLGKSAGKGLGSPSLGSGSPPGFGLGWGIPCCPAAGSPVLALTGMCGASLPWPCLCSLKAPAASWRER